MLSFFLLLLHCTPLQAQRSDRLTLQLNRASLAEFVRAVEAATDYTFVYSEDVQLAEPITLNVLNASLKNVLNTALEGQPVRWEIEGNHILLMRQRAQVRNVVLSGRVTDAQTGEPLAGATIYNATRRTGTSTNASGQYKLTLPSNRNMELTISYVGYISQEQTIILINDKELDIRLRQDTRSLRGVEVVGNRHNFGPQSSQMSAQAVTVKQIQEMPVLLGEPDVLKTLQRLPGVQSSGEGRAGIFVRGGDYDQNLFTLDGITLYNPEHLQGFTSAINSDVLEDVVLFKGAFPARYGGRLSSVVESNLMEGDMERYHASITAGILASRLQVEGPIWKNHTSFNVGARISYFNAIVKPMLKEVIYDNPGQLNNYSKMRYYDINAKLVHRFNDKAKLSAVFYLGYDQNNATPNETTQHFERQKEVENKITREKRNYTFFTDNTEQIQTLISWNNILGGLTYSVDLSPVLKFDTQLSYSGYDSKQGFATRRESLVNVNFSNNDPLGGEVYTHSIMEDYSDFRTQVDDLSARATLTFTPNTKHELHTGLQGSSLWVTPSVTTYHATFDQTMKDDSYITIVGLGDERYDFNYHGNYKTIDNKQQELILSTFVDDDWSISESLKANIGLRFQAYRSGGKTNLALEPRASARWLISKDAALKASYARMSQGLFLLSSGNILRTTDIWIPNYKDMKLGISDQVSVGYSQELKGGYQLSVEGYYKWMDNVVEYKEGVSFYNENDWERMVAQGRGRAYGVELMAQKTLGSTTGMVNYTWSKSLRTFDRKGMELNGGLEYYALSDFRHNINISITQRLSKNWDFSAAWSYQSGRRGTIASTTQSGPYLDEFNANSPSTASDLVDIYEQNPAYSQIIAEYYQDSFVRSLLRMNTFYSRNSFQLPATHHLDISLRHHGSIGIGEMICDIGIYNIYNQQNIASVYWGYEQNKRALKGICLFPIMPSLSLTLKL